MLARVNDLANVLGSAAADCFGADLGLDFGFCFFAMAFDVAVITIIAAAFSLLLLLL